MKSKKSYSQVIYNTVVLFGLHVNRRCLFGLHVDRRCLSECDVLIGSPSEQTLWLWWSLLITVHQETLVSPFCLSVCLQVQSDNPDLLSVCPSVSAAVQQHACVFASSTSRSTMEVKERRPYCSLTKGRRDREGPYTGEILHSAHCFCMHWLADSVSDSEVTFGERHIIIYKTKHQFIFWLLQKWGSYQFPNDQCLSQVGTW